MNHEHQVNGTPAEATDDELIIRLKKGDIIAFDVLYDRHFEAVYRYTFYRVGNNVHEAEDITQAVFTRAFEALETYHLRGVPFRSWLYRIAHNLVVDHYRMQKSTAVDIDDQPSLLDDSIQPEDKVVQIMNLEHIKTMMSQLDETQQEVLTLRLIMGLSHEETAQIMGRTAGSVRVIQTRALKTLRTMLKVST